MVDMFTHPFQVKQLLKSWHHVVDVFCMKLGFVITQPLNIVSHGTKITYRGISAEKISEYIVIAPYLPTDSNETHRKHREWNSEMWLPKEGKDIPELTTAFNDYALNKKYDTYFGDAPLLCANALGMNIITLIDSHKGCLSKIMAGPAYSGMPLECNWLTQFTLGTTWRPSEYLQGTPLCKSNGTFFKALSSIS